MKRDKRIAFKIMFFISFIPYIEVLLRALYHSIFGYNKYTWILQAYIKTCYGIEAIKESIIYDGCIILVTICLIYEITYIFCLRRKFKYKK